MRERQPRVQWDDAGLRTSADESEDQYYCGKSCSRMPSTDCIECVVPIAAREQAESQQQRKRTEARHQQVDVTGLQILAFAMMRDDQCPGAKRHELPRHEKAECVVSEHHKVHDGEIGRVKWQDAFRRSLVAAIAQREQACRRATQVDDNEKEGRKRIDAEVCA